MLFHADVFMPPCAKAPAYVGPLQYGRHALDEAKRDRYGEIQLPPEFHKAGAKLIEAEVLTATDTVVKQVWRQPLDEQRDLVLVISSSGYVRTVWVNLRSDKHATLDSTKPLKRRSSLRRSLFGAPG